MVVISLQSFHMHLNHKWEICASPVNCIALYLSIYIAPLNSHRQREALLVQLAPRKETSFKYSSITVLGLINGV